MKRRAALGAIGSGIAVLAGCSGSPDAAPDGAATVEPSTTTNESPTTTERSTATATSEPERREAEPVAESDDAQDVRLLSIAAPDRVQLGESVRYRFTVENAGEASRTVEPTVESRTGASAWSVHERWEPVELAPGNRHTFESPRFTREYLETVEFRIDGFAPTFSIEFAERELPFERGYRDPAGREVRVNDVTIKSSYEYTSDGLRRLAEVEDGYQFVFVDVEVVNQTDEPIGAPPADEFSLLEGETAHQSVPMAGDAGYEAGELPWGSRTDGLVAYETRASLVVDDVRVGWRTSFDGGDVGVIWTPP